jgi:uncharacterized protein (DUF111 family)
MTAPANSITAGTVEDARIGKSHADVLDARAENQALADAKKEALKTGIPMGTVVDTKVVEAEHKVEVAQADAELHAQKQEFADKKKAALDSGIPMDPTVV